MRGFWVIASFFLVVVVTGAWVYIRPGWDSIAALTAAVATLIGVIAKTRAKPTGTGGAAVRAGLGTDVNVENEGTIQAGTGGTGGSGGDAVRVGPGVTLNIKNKGVISGGDAGNK